MSVEGPRAEAWRFITLGKRGVQKAPKDGHGESGWDAGWNMKCPKSPWCLMVHPLMGIHWSQFCLFPAKATGGPRKPHLFCCVHACYPYLAHRRSCLLLTAVISPQIAFQSISLNWMWAPRMQILFWTCLCEDTSWQDACPMIQANLVLYFSMRQTMLYFLFTMMK